MGRNTTTPLPQSLDRFSVGEIADLSGVANFYNAGTSKWLRSATYVDGSLLPESTKLVLAASQTSATTVALATPNDLSLNTSRPVFREKWQEAYIDAVSTTVIATRFPSSTVNVIALTPAGAQPVNVVASGHLAGSEGSTSALASNNSKFFVYYFTSTSAMACKSSTDGITWSTETLTNMPTISGVDSNSVFWDSSSQNYFQLNYGFGYQTTSAESYGAHAVLWCGARFLLLTKGASTTVVASLSTNGVAWSNNTDTAAILGSASIAFIGSHINFYRNGNNCYLAVGANYRYSSDGGVTWAASTTTLNPNVAANIPNVTDPTKRIIQQGESNSLAYYTSNSGQSWSANRALPQIGRYSLAYRGSTVVMGTISNGCYRSVDDGVTWSSIVFPAGTNLSNGEILADVYRYYFLPSGQNQILTSTDAITWTIIATPGNVSGNSYDSLFTVSSNVVYLTQGAHSQGLFTLNGGVTWAYANSGSSSIGGNVYGYPSTPTTYGGTGGYMIQGYGSTAVANYFLLSVAALIAGGAFYRTGTTVISPARANALSYVRVA